MVEITSRPNWKSTMVTISGQSKSEVAEAYQAEWRRVKEETSLEFVAYFSPARRKVSRHKWIWIATLEYRKK